ncbi:MAG: right-handed parallel beta-helix repeat-containing protein [Planctomycetota bacterium]|nr:MAG: right-handed parallel beta-helix repeat-containing protein [Planctomycetota bacterium]
MILRVCVLIVILLTGFECAIGGEVAETQDGSGTYVYEPYSAVSTELLSAYEADYESFIGVEISDRIVYFKQRKIGEAIVQGDYILYHFDKYTEELLDLKMEWREDLPGKLPAIISMLQAELLVDGEVRFCKLYYICSDSDVVPIDPTPENPCWVVETVKDGKIDVVVIDAVEGKILGHGIPPPYTAFSLTGPIEQDPKLCTCSSGWYSWYENAEYWFNTMGYDTDVESWPTEEEVRSHIQSDTTALFYELAHGGSAGFSNGCDSSSCSMETTTASEIEAWIADYEKMPFAFLGSCGGMCDTNDNTLSYEFRKGSNEYTTTVGYCGMSGQPCVDSCWYSNYTVPWQNLMFAWINQGWTVKAAFDRANGAYPGCGANGCMRFAGDESFGLVPVVEREPGEIQVAIYAASDGDKIVVQPGRHYGKVNFRGKNIILASTDPNDANVIAATIIDGNSSGSAVAFSSGEEPNCILTGFTITGGSSGSGHAGISCVGLGTNPTVKNCVITGNLGAGIHCGESDSSSQPTILNCTVCDNGGPGIETWGRNTASIMNCTIVGNGMDGIYSMYGAPRIINCTVASNLGHGTYEGRARISNSIFWGNGGEEIYSGAPLVTYSDVQGGYAGLGNIDADPCFVLEGYWEYNEPNWFFSEGDYHLQSGAGRWDSNTNSWVTDVNTSVCIDAGNPGCSLGDEPSDGNNVRINMGAYGGTSTASKPPLNWRSIADLTNDLAVDFNDIGVFVDYWLDIGECLPSDLDRSQSVDFGDFGILADDWLWW